MLSDAPLSIESREGKASGTRVFHLTGPITLPNVFALQSELRNGEPPQVSILDLAGVPYMDSAGMGAIVNYYTHCERKGSHLIVAAVSNRVMELFTMTKVNKIIPMAATVAEAEARA